MRKAGLIFTLLFALVTVVAAQKQPHDLSIERGLDKSTRYVMLSDTIDSKYRFGKYKSFDFDSIMARMVTGFEHADKHWWNANLTATQNVTHDARYRSSVVDHIGYWNLNAGHTPQGTIQFDSTAYVVVDSQIVLKGRTLISLYGNTGLNPLIRIDDVNNRIILSESAGDIRLRHLVVDPTTQFLVGIDTSTGQLKIVGKSNLHNYSGIWSQSSTAAPSISSLLDNLGATATWSRQSTGVYRLTCTGCFSGSPVFVQNRQTYGTKTWYMSATNANYIEITTDGGSGAADAAMPANIFFEIREY